MDDKLDLIVNSQEYYFQKLEDVFKNFDDYEISNNQIEILIGKVIDFYQNNNSKSNKFLEFIEENKEYKEFFNLIGQIISMCDLNASNKEYFNPYDDKRVVAKAGVRQNDWIINLLKYKKNGLEEIPSSIKATIEYIKDPENNLTVLSKNHKNLISEKLLKSEYLQDTFIRKLKEYFDKELNKYQVVNKKNINIIISNLLYTNEIKNIWLSEKYIEDAFKKWLLSIKKLEPSTFDKYTGRLKNGIPQKLFDVKFKTKKESLYTLTSSDLMKINELFEKNSYDLESWNKDKTKTEAWNSLKYLIEFLNNNEELVTVPAELKGKDNMNSKLPLNQILYGSPGTGKTYHTINKALEIIFSQNNKCSQNKEDKTKKYKVTYKIDDCKTQEKEISYEEAFFIKDRVALKHIFEEYKNAGQIEFVTFHQSYGYEEFVEGIKAKTNEERKQIEYEIEAGIFKKLCEKAKTIKAQTNKLDFDWNRGNIFKMSLGGKNDSEILDWCVDNEYISMGWGNEIDFSSVTAQSWESFRDKAKSLYQNLDTDRFTLQAMYAFKEWMKKDDLVFVSLGNLKIVAIGQVIGDYEYKENIDEIRYSQFRKVKWLFIDKSGIPVEKLLNKKLSQQTIYNLDKSYVKKDFLDSLFNENDKEQLKNYILIIDEINRGNISKIFGELITLIEPSKRIGADEEIRLKLPYSGDTEKPFGVPQNLYIIGTMNTADRSIAPIDTALRRRFVFEEMAPNPSTLTEIKVQVSKEDTTDTGIKLNELLEAINTRIEYLYDSTS